jgi:hypothetical protein
VCGVCGTHWQQGGDSSGKEAYRCVVQVILAKNKITPDEKRILRGFRYLFVICYLFQVLLFIIIYLLYFILF